MECVFLVFFLLLFGQTLSFAPGVSKIARNVREFDLNMKLIVGLNKYSHDASVCIVDAKDGNILFAQAKERITGKKHDGGATGDLLRYGLRTIDASVDDVQLVVSNNHHFRIGPFENRIEFYRSLDYIPSDYDDPLNLLSNVEHIELSHHLAHAWSVASTAPFREGLILVMDGMGEQYKVMAEDMGGLEKPMVYYMHDLKLLKEKGDENFVGVPTALRPGSTYREAETAYMFDSTGLTPLYKRWSRERSPPELYNHGFENMESMGAVYSRISSHILGDWNACGKVMGLGPWAGRQKNEAASWIFNQKLDNLNLGEDFHHTSSFMTGNPFIDSETSEDNSGFNINWDILDNLKNSNEFSIGRFDELANIAHSIQDNLEDSATSLVNSLQDISDAKNLALAGGVALNSVLNGKLMREGNFDKIFIPPAPGDEGIAVGCAMYGLQQIREREDKEAPLVSTHMPVYQGRSFNDEVVDDVVFESIPWAVADQFESLDEAAEEAAKAISEGKVIGWFQGRSEFGQRALGSRSFLADPRDANMRSYINQYVKAREWWRPLAPSILASEAGNWFENLDNDEEGGGQSPYMSVTSYVKMDKVHQVPSIVHVDGSARLQTVGEVDAPLYHKLIKAFFKLTGVPMVLNTSLNRKGPIVESPEQAIQTLLACNGHCSELFIGKWRVKPRQFPLEDPKTMKQAYGTVTPKEEEKCINVHGVRYYISEVTAGPSVESEPLRIRVQDGKGRSGVGGQDEWKILPTNLHLEVLQLLQPQDEAAYDVSSGASYTAAEEELPDVTIEDLWEAMKEVREYNITWSQIVDVLKWLFQNQLCYFNDPTDETGTGEIDPAILFKNVRVTDLRE